MASNKFVFTKEAEIDIDQAIYYIVNELGDKSAAKRLYDKLFTTFKEYVNSHIVASVQKTSL